MQGHRPERGDDGSGDRRSGRVDLAHHVHHHVRDDEPTWHGGGAPPLRALPGLAGRDVGDLLPDPGVDAGVHDPLVADRLLHGPDRATLPTLLPGVHRASGA